MFGSLGFVWAYAWWKWFRDTPEEHAAVGDAERAYIAAGRPPFEERAGSLCWLWIDPARPVSG